MGSKRFRGKYDHTVDDKGRLSFPSRFREVLRLHESEVLVVIPWDNHLRAYPLAEWEVLENKLKAEDPQQSGDLEKIIRYFESESFECVLDKQGRILLPPVLRNEIGLKRDIVLIGMIDRVEIWDGDTWNEERAVSREHFGTHKASIKKRGIIEDTGVAWNMSCVSKRTTPELRNSRGAGIRGGQPCVRCGRFPALLHGIERRRQNPAQVDSPRAALLYSPGVGSGPIRVLLCSSAARRFPPGQPTAACGSSLAKKSWFFFPFCC